MRRFWLNSALRYLDDADKDVPVTTCIQVKVKRDIRSEPSERSQQEVDFSPDELNFTTEPEPITKELMEQPENINLYTEPAYLIYRGEIKEGEVHPEMIPVPSNQIIRLESTANYCYVYTTNGERTLVAMAMKWVAHHLNGFIRSHRSHAINPLFIADYLLDRADVGEIDRFMLLRNGEKIPWSRRHLKEARRDYSELFKKKRSLKAKKL